jgi:O-antigen ligase
MHAGWLAAASGLAVFAIAYDDGGYSLESRSAVALALWWAILLAVGLGVWPVGRLPRAAVVTGTLLGLLAAWDLASAAWSASAEDAFSEFDRTALYAGIYVLVVAAVESGSLDRLVDGLILGIVGTAIVSLVSRLFPGSFPGRGLPELLPSSNTRLSFPLGYWNGLGSFAGLAVPLLLYSALAGGRARRMLSFAAFPALGAVVYLTSSRGAVAAIAGGVLVFVVAQPRRFTALAATAAAGLGMVAAIAAVASRPAVVDGPFTSSAARTGGREAAVAIVLLCVATPVLVEGALAVFSRFRPPSRHVRRGVAALVVVSALVVVAHEALVFRDFTRLPTATTAGVKGNAVSDHLLSGSGSGRWQFWTAALDEFRSSPLYGRGAGSYESWWARHGSFRYFVKDAHSLYLQTLGELGLVGFVLLAGALGAGLVVGVSRLRRAAGARQTAIAGVLGAYTGYLIASGIDWMWELTAVTAIGICLLGLLTGAASLPPPVPADGAGHRRRLVPAIAVAVLAAAVIVAQAIVLLTTIEVGASQADAGRGELAGARSHAIAATRIEAWAASPYLQLALVEQERGDLRAASTAIGRAVSRDGDDWRPWLVASRIQTALGQTAASAASLARARSLDPRSEILRAPG